jgi:hypothetical protein
VSLTDLVGTLLPALDRVFPTDLVGMLDRFLGEFAGADRIDLLLADYDLRFLVCLRHDTPSVPAEVQPIGDTDAGRAFATQATVAVYDGGRTTLYLPVSLRAERLGVLRVEISGPVPADTLEGLAQVATVVGYVVFAAGRFTDIYEQARRRKTLGLDAEMQWTLLPVRAFSCAEFDIAGHLMPAYHVGGDCFDYSVETDALHLSVTDAMGHGVSASLLDGLTVGALRNSRRGGASVAEQAQTAHAVVHQQFGGAQFVTALIARLDIDTGQSTMVSAGFPPVHRLRAGRAERIVLSAQLPLGLFPDTAYRAERLELHPGDRLLFTSDGVIEAGPSRAQPFGDDRLDTLLLATAQYPPHEAVRHILQTVSDYEQGEFRDDATVLCLDWHGGRNARPAATAPSP